MLFVELPRTWVSTAIQDIANCIAEVAKDFDIDTTKVVAVVHDTTANVQLAGVIMYRSFEWENAQCAGQKTTASN